MASGYGHERFNLTGLGLALGAYGIAEYQGLAHQWGLTWPMVTSFTIAFLVGTLLVTPDLDLAENHVRAKKNWGFLGIIWVPYGYLFRHRGWSHGWILGPLTRLIYLSGLVGIAVASAKLAAETSGYSLNLAADWRPTTPSIALSGLIGFYISQWLHLIADGVLPWHGLRKFLQ